MIERITGYHPIPGKGRSADPAFYRFYTPSDVKATVLIIHGMQEHSGRYEELACFLAGNGFAVLSYDQHGHGRTAATRAEQGFIRPERPEQLLLDTAAAMQLLLTEKYAEKPCFVIGHSMGSFVTRALLGSCSDKFAGAVLVGTGGYRSEMGILKSFFAVSNRFFPRHRTVFNHLFLAANNWKFRKEPGPGSIHWLSQSQHNRDAFNNDELCGIPFTNNGFLTLFSVYTQATGSGWANAVRRDLPMAFISGEEDPIGQFGKGVRQTIAELERLDFCDISVQLYASMRHEILNESIRPLVFEYLLNWLNSHLIRTG